jgi:hypothetical protein
MRRLFTSESSGLTSSQLKWGVRAGHWVRVQQAVYADGPEPPTKLDRERAKAMSSCARGALAGVLHQLDGVTLDGRPTRRDAVSPIVVAGLPCADGRQTLLDLALTLDDDRSEQALESALRKRLVTIADFDGVRRARIRRVLARRPPGTPPTESLLETLAVQLARTVPGLGEPVRQHRVTWEDGAFVARVDLCWPDLGLFLELDGQHHQGQPVYDARRQTAVTAATGWLCGRFTWHEIVHVPRATARPRAGPGGAGRPGGRGGK